MLPQKPPQPPQDVCLSIDVGSINCGVCLFDGHSSKQNIMLCGKQQLLDEHATVLHQNHVAQVKQHLDSMRQLLDTILQGRAFWVLIEQQFLDHHEAKHGLIFPLQLESCITMYFMLQGIQVRNIQCTKRYSFLGINNWKQDSQWQRKQRVVTAISRLLDPLTPNNGFALREHDLSGWQQTPSSQRSDIADAIAQCLAYFYRNMQAVLECRPVPTGIMNTGATAGTSSSAQPSKTKLVRTQRPSLAELCGKLEQTLAQLEIRHHALIKAERTAANKLYKVLELDPSNSHLLAFFDALHAYNQAGRSITTREALKSRLDQLCQASPSAAAMLSGERPGYSAS